MKNLSYFDLKSLHECVGSVYSYMEELGIEDFQENTLKSIRKITASLYSTFTDTSQTHERPPVSDPIDIEFPENASEIFTTYVHEHPLIQYHKNNKKTAAIKTTDCFDSIRYYHRLNIYNNFFRGLRSEYQAAIGIHIGGNGIIGICLNRDRMDFSDRDMACLEYLREHISRAFRIAKKFESLKQANVAEGLDKLKKALQMTKQQANVSFLIYKGLTYGEISSELGLSYDGVKGHMERIRKKLKVGKSTLIAARVAEVFNSD